MNDKMNVKYELCEINDVNTDDKCTPDQNVVRCISRIARVLGRRFMESIIYSDPQYKAIRSLALRADELLLYRLVIYNSLVSYRLRETGEEYWSAFAHEVSLDKDPIAAVIDFIRSRKELAVNGKVKRLEALRGHDLRVDYYLKHPAKLYTDLMSVYKFKYSKTAAFAVKMFCYAAIAKGRNITMPASVPMPVDSRVLRASYRIGLISRSCKSPAEVAKAWERVARSSRIPALVLDSFVWGLIEGEWKNPL